MQKPEYVLLIDFEWIHYRCLWLSAVTLADSVSLEPVRCPSTNMAN